MNSANWPPEHGRRFYSILGRSDGRVDVFLNPRVYPMTTPEGMTDFDISVLVVRDVEYTDDLEEDIRRRFDDWCELGEEISL